MRKAMFFGWFLVRSGLCGLVECVRWSREKELCDLDGGGCMVVAGVWKDCGVYL